MGMSEIRDSLAASLTWKVPDFGLPRRPSRRGKVGVFPGLTAPRSRGSGNQMDFSYLGKLVFSSMNGLLWHQEANSFGSV